MTVNSFFDHAINIASDKHVLFLAGIVFFAISKAKDREKFLAKAELSEDEYQKFSEALSRPYDIPFLREFLKKIVATAIDKVSKENATEEQA